MHSALTATEGARSEAQQDRVTLRLSGVSKSFQEPSGRLRVLQNLDLEVAAGAVLVLQGPSGSGKSTLLQIAGALLRADDGEVWVGGQEVNGAAEDMRLNVRRRHLGFAFQHFHLIDALSVEQNVALGLHLKRLPVDAELIQQTLSLLGISAKAGKLPRDLSGGEKQRVAFARAVVGRPSLLLVDEPTSQLDSHSAGQVAGMIEAVSETGATVVIATHDPRLYPIADRVCTLKDGGIIE